MRNDEGSIKAFEYYANSIKRLGYTAKNGADNPDHDTTTELGHLLWMCEHCIEHIDSMPVDKYSRWLGYIQGCLITHGLTTVQEERDRTRPWFT